MFSCESECWKSCSLNYGQVMEDGFSKTIRKIGTPDVGRYGSLHMRIWRACVYVCLCVCTFCIFSWIQSSVFTQCFAWMKSFINKCNICIMLKLALNISLTLEHICVYKTSFIAELTVFPISKLHSFHTVTEKQGTSNHNQRYHKCLPYHKNPIKDHLRLVVNLVEANCVGD